MLDKCRVLYAEDEELIRNNMRDIFHLMFKEVYIAKDGKEALKLYEKELPDILILDIEMPYFTGLEVAKNVREINKNVPIIIATAYTDTKYFLLAIEHNITSYILKPIMMDSLKNALKKCQDQLSYIKNDVIRITRDVYYNIEDRSLHVKEKLVTLTNIEMLFLEYMLKNPNRVIGYEEFENNIWSEEGMTGGAIRSLVRDLRKYLGKESIQNLSKVGYKLVII